MQALKICTKITVPKFHSTSVTCDYDGGTSCHSLLLVATRHPNRLPSFAVVNEPGLVAVEEACVVACYCDCTFEVADGVVVHDDALFDFAAFAPDVGDENALAAEQPHYSSFAASWPVKTPAHGTSSVARRTPSYLGAVHTRPFCASCQQSAALAEY